MNQLPEPFIEYLKPFNKAYVDKFIKVRTWIFEASDVLLTEKMSYQMPTFFYKKVVCHIGLFNKHLSLFPTPKAIEVFKDRLKDYKTSKGTIQMPYDKVLDKNLIQDIIKFNLSEQKK